jgi:GR25 family glycosyltransferase involved in LPS biosynthesis
VKIRDIPFYVVHYKANIERKKYLSSWFGRNKISAIWVTEGQREDLTEEVIGNFYKFDPKIYERKLNLSEIGCTIAHIWAYKDIIKNKHDYAIVLEDDAVFSDNFIEKFDEIFETIPEDCDIVSLGSCCNLKIQNTNQEYGIYKKIPFQTRCAFSQLLTSKSCQIFIENSIPFSWPIDWQWLEIQGFTGRPPKEKNKLTMYWAEPSLIYQGSEIGTYNSSIR